MKNAKLLPLRILPIFLILTFFNCGANESHQNTVDSQADPQSKTIIISQYEAEVKNGEISPGRLQQRQIKQYNELDQPARERTEVREESVLNHDLSIEYHYDSEDRLIKKSYRTINNENGREGGWDIRYTYNDERQIIKEEKIHPGTGTVTDRVSYQYDNLGRKSIGVEDLIKGNTQDYRYEYQYNSDDQLIKEIRSHQEGFFKDEITTYEYDQYGNRILECNIKGRYQKCRYWKYDQHKNLLESGNTRRLITKDQKPDQYREFHYPDMDEQGEWTQRITYSNRDLSTPLSITIRTKEK